MKHVASIQRRWKIPLPSWLTEQRGVTGLETAIILIAFVVVASVFAFTVLSTGIFSAERGKETIYAGLKEARSSIQLKGSVIANGVTDKLLSDADSAWTALTNVTATADSTDKKEGDASADIAIGASFTTGLAAYENLSQTVSLTSTDSIQLWVKSSVDTDAGDLELVLDDSAGCASSLENIDLPALAANTWKLATVGISDNSDMSAIACVGLNVATNNGSQTVNLDYIFGRGQATSLVLTLANALEGDPVDVTPPSDSDGDKLADSGSTHKLLVSYIDKDQRVNDIYWTRSFIGTNDEDNLLEQGEKVELTIDLEGLAQATPLVKDVDFSIELRPEEGGAMVIERTMPSNIDTVMNLN